MPYEEGEERSLPLMMGPPVICSRSLLCSLRGSTTATGAVRTFPGGSHAPPLRLALPPQNFSL